MDQAPYRAMPTSDTAALIRENRVLREMLRVAVAVFVMLAVIAFFIAFAATSVRAEVGLAALLVLVAAVVFIGRKVIDVLLAIAASLPAFREETGVRVDASEPAALLPAPPMTVSALKHAVDDAALAVRIRPDDADRVARHQILLSQLHELETTGRLTAK